MGISGITLLDLLTRSLHYLIKLTYTYRINGIEAGRLDKQIQILERQKLHTVRLVNNNIRLTRITLEHIEASSGRSVDQQGILYMYMKYDHASSFIYQYQSCLVLDQYGV